MSHYQNSLTRRPYSESQTVCAELVKAAGDEETAGSLRGSAAGSAAKELYLARGLRDFGDGFVAVLLPVYLAALGLDLLQIGIVATMALLGSACLTLAIGWYGTTRDHRRLLVLAS